MKERKERAPYQSLCVREGGPRLPRRATECKCADGLVRTRDISPARFTIEEGLLVSKSHGSGTPAGDVGSDHTSAVATRRDRHSRYIGTESIVGIRVGNTSARGAFCLSVVSDSSHFRIRPLHKARHRSERPVSICRQWLTTLSEFLLTRQVFARERARLT